MLESRSCFQQRDPAKAAMGRVPLEIPPIFKSLILDRRSLAKLAKENLQITILTKDTLPKICEC